MNLLDVIPLLNSVHKGSATRFAYVSRLGDVDFHVMLVQFVFALELVLAAEFAKRLRRIRTARTPEVFVQMPAQIVRICEDDLAKDALERRHAFHVDKDEVLLPEESVVITGFAVVFPLAGVTVFHAVFVNAFLGFEAFTAYSALVDVRFDVDFEVIDEIVFGVGADLADFAYHRDGSV